MRQDNFDHLDLATKGLSEALKPPRFLSIDDMVIAPSRPTSATNLTASREFSRENFDKLEQDLRATMKAKVELMRETSRTYKDAEGAKRELYDKVLKLERDLELSIRDCSRVRTEYDERETVRGVRIKIIQDSNVLCITRFL